MNDTLLHLVPERYRSLEPDVNSTTDFPLLLHVNETEQNRREAMPRNLIILQVNRASREG